MTKRKTQEQAREVFASAGATMVGEYVTSNARVECVCDACGATVWLTYKHARNSHGCKYCGIVRRGLSKRKTQQQARKMFASAGATMVGEYVAALDPVECVCDACGATVWKPYASVQQGGRVCSYCSRRAPKTQEQAREMFKSAGATMVGEYVRVGDGVECIHDECGRTIYPRYDSIRGEKGPCIFCSPKSPKTQDQARAMFKSAGATMVGEYVRALDPVECVCDTCGATIWQTYSRLQQGGRVCASCADYGYDPTKPGWLYLMAGDHDGLPWLKVGITNNDPADRAKRVGGTIIDSVLYENGADAHRDEQELLGQLGDLRGTGIPEGGDGYTESWSAWLMTVTTLTELRERYAVAA
jgi:hypothetical protein